jgi:hypothetical protein
VQHDAIAEWLSGPGTMTGLVEALGDLGVGVVVE